MKKSTVMTALFLLFAAASGRAAEYSRANAGWYIGFGIGWGTAWAYAESASAEDRGGLGMFKVGGVLGPNLLLGFEGGSWFSWAEDSEVSFSHNDCMLTYFPWSEAGFFVKAGAGLGWIGVRSGDSWGKSRAGFDVRVGTGYEFQLGRSFNLGVEGVWSSTFFEEIHLGDAGIMMTFTWY